LTDRVVLATILHDIDGNLAAPLLAAGPALRTHFAGLAVSLTEGTDSKVAEVLEDELGASLAFHPVGDAIIGRARRDAVRLALELSGDRILYSDVDHILRWLETDADEMAACLAAQQEAQLLIIGRTEEAMMLSPQRLRETEVPVNKAYELMSGRRADLLFAIRRMDRNVAADIVEHSHIDSIANDVEWPLLAERLGHRVGYSEAHGLSYRTIDEYGAAADSYDKDALQWIRRIEMAGEMARAMRPFLSHS
jgi:hypothetical protein